MTEHPSVRHGSVTRLQGDWLLAARVTWVAIAAWALALFVISLPAYYRLLQLPCTGTTACQLNGALTPAGMHTLQAFGFSPSGYVAYTITLNIVLVVVWSAVGFVIFWRRSDEWMALLVAALRPLLFLLLLLAACGAPPPSGRQATPTPGKTITPVRTVMPTPLRLPPSLCPRHRPLVLQRERSALPSCHRSHWETIPTLSI